MTTALLLFAVALLVGLNGFFVAAEFALVRVQRDRMEADAEEGKRGAALALRQLTHIDEYLSACQVGITLASIAIGFLGEKALGEIIARPLEGTVGALGATLVGIGIAYFVTTFAHITAGEQVPKIFSITHAEATARAIAGPLQWFRVGARPFIWLVNASSNAMLRIAGVDPKAEFEESANTEDVKMLIARGMQGGTLDAGEADMLAGVFHLHEQQARQVMTPLPAVVTADVSDTVENALRRCVESGHTRLVITEDESTDHVRGMVHSNSLARLLMERGPGASFEEAVKDVVIMPETKPLDDLLTDLQRERMSMAVVVDEYGRTVGIVSVEDIVEEVVGEIIDETDPASQAVRRLANGDWYVRGHVPITDLEDHGISLPVESDTFNSIGGFVFHELGRLPKGGDMVRAHGYSVRVEAVRENRVEAVRIRDHEPGSRNGRGERPVGLRSSPEGDRPGEDGEPPPAAARSQAVD